MSQQLQLGEEVSVRRVDGADGVTYVADFGPKRDVSADVVGDTVIVVADGQQHETQLPETGDAEVFIRNGVLTIEVNA